MTSTEAANQSHWTRAATRGAPSICLLAFLVFPAGAQPPTTQIQLDQQLAGVIEPPRESGQPSQIRDYLVTARQDDVLIIDMESPDFDTYLEVTRLGSDEVLASDDDSGESLNAQLRFRAPEDGSYRIRAQAFSSGYGPFTLSLRSGPAVTTTSLLENTTGALSAESPLLPDDDPGSRFSEYSFRGNASERIQVRVSAQFPSPRLQLIGPDGTELSDLQAEENSREVTLISALPQAGEYRLRVIGEGREYGDFNVAMNRAVGGSPTAPIALPIGTIANGLITLESNVYRPRFPPGRAFFYSYYAVRMRPNQSLELVIDSDQFSPTADVGALSPVGFASASVMFRRTLRSYRATITSERGGELIVRVRSLDPRRVLGAFTITARPQPSSSARESAD